MQLIAPTSAPSTNCTRRRPSWSGSTTSASTTTTTAKRWQVLLDSYRRDAGLTALGSKMNRFFLRGALVARLLSEAAWKQYPQHADVAIERPIFVTGLPRTGTTALHRLLGADPAHQGLHLWLAEFPQPRPPRETWESNPFYRQLDAQFTKAHEENPDYTGLHFMAAYELEECWQLLRQSLHSVSYETLAHLPSYSQWLSQQDWTPSYQRHRRNLQLIGLNDAEQALGAEESQPPVRAGRVDGDLSRRAGDPDPPAGRDDHGLDVLAGAAHRRGVVDDASPAPRSVPTRWKPGRAAWSGSMPHAPNMIRLSSTTSTTAI